MKNKKFVPRKRKPIREITTSKNYSGEQSPYWDFVATNAHRRSQDGVGGENGIEDPLANPDVLSEEDSLYNRPLTAVGELQKQAVEEMVGKLSERERAVFDLCADQGKTEEEAAEVMGVTRRSIRTFLTRIRAKMKKRLGQLLLEEK